MQLTNSQIWNEAFSRFSEFFTNIFSLESWHNDTHLLDNIKVFVEEVFSSKVDPIDLFRLGMTDKVTLEWSDVSQQSGPSPS
jgi:hypothetical protein